MIEWPATLNPPAAAVHDEGTCCTTKLNDKSWDRSHCFRVNKPDMDAVDSSNERERADRPASELYGTEEATSPVHPVAPYPPLFGAATSENARVRAKSVAGGRAPEFYGFVAWLITLLVYFTYVLWALLPDWAIRTTGITWYPARCAFIPSFPAYTCYMN